MGDFVSKMAMMCRVSKDTLLKLYFAYLKCGKISFAKSQR